MTDSERSPDKSHGDPAADNATAADVAGGDAASGDPAIVDPTTGPPVDTAAGEFPDRASAPVFLGPAPSRSRVPLGPGLWEALLWIAAFFVIEICGSFGWVVAVTAWRTVTTGGAPISPDAVAGLLTPVMPWMIGSIKLFEVIAAVIAIRLRFGPQAFRATGFRPFSVMHAFVLGLAIVPTAFLSGQCFALLQGYWEQLAEHLPGLRWFDGLSSIEAVQEMAASTSLPLLVLIIAVLPALNEELVFRAAIGRGLLGRYGLIAGISLTSMLFAAVHLSPVHAAALVPLAVLMHVGYVSSGSIWWAVIVHFLNNALSVILMKLATISPEVGGMTADVTEASFSPIVFFAAVACVVTTVWLLMTIRVRWRYSDGIEWRPAIESVEPPPPGIESIAFVPAPAIAPLLAAIASYLVFPVALIGALLLGQL